MKRIIPIMLLIGGVGLLALAFMFYQTSERIKRDNDSLRDLSMATNESPDDYDSYTPEPEPDYDPTDLEQTPPGVTPFMVGSICSMHWGTQMRQYCEDGDTAVLEIVEGTTQAEEMRTLTMCLNEMLQRIDVYEDPDMRPMDSLVPLDQENRQALACDMTDRYGDSPVFANGSIGYIIKEHVESGNISRLENR